MSQSGKSQVRHWIIMMGLPFFLPLYFVHADWASDSLYKTNANGIPYMLYIPLTYDPTNQYPLVFFLHGGGGEGTDNVAHVWNGASGKNSWVAMGNTFILAPQGPVNSGWANSNNMAPAYQVLQSELTNYTINTRRLYVTGLSRGGRATWNLIADYPHIFAAGVPICGWGDRWLTSDPGMALTSSWAHFLVDTPIWAHHGLADAVVPPINSRWMYLKVGQAITNAGRAVNTNELKLTEYPGVDHNSWDTTYNDPTVHLWMFDHWLGETEPPAEPAGLTALEVTDNRVVFSWISTNDPATIDHFNIYRNGELVVTATEHSYTNHQLEPFSNYIYRISAVNHRGMISPTSPALGVWTYADYSPPGIVGVTALSWNRVRLDFTEPIETQLTVNAGNFSIDNGIAVLSSDPSTDCKSIVLTTSFLSNSTPYSITVHNAEDLAGRRANDLQAVFQHQSVWTRLPWRESFENFAVGSALWRSNSWVSTRTNTARIVDDADIIRRLTNAYVGGYPISTSHTQVVQVDEGTVTRLFGGDSRVTNQIDFVLEPAPWPSSTPPPVATDDQVALYLNTNRHLVVWHGYFSGSDFSNKWTELMHNPIQAPTQWVRLTITQDYSAEPPFFKIQLNGVPPITNAMAYSGKAPLVQTGEWFIVANTNNPFLSSFTASGCEFDDLVITTETNPATPWTLTILALTNGMILSSNNASIGDGQDVHFSVQASEYYRIMDVKSNGVSFGISYGTNATWHYIWSNVTQNGTIQAFFTANVTTNTGTPIWWIAQHYGGTNFETVALLDTDGDGMATWEEQIAETQPTNNHSVFRCQQTKQEDNRLFLYWPSASNRLYALDTATNLINDSAWVELDHTLPATPPINAYTAIVDNAETRLFRTRVRINE